ncbi:MAG: hypothetical protein K2H76_02370, partial [Muribaculaceae bacterium]|nr:hypothetical protein [Muribaculaceae bacterium]
SKYIMANKREFKKYVDALGASACEEMMYAYHTVEQADKDAISKAIEKVLLATNKARMNANIFFDRGAKAFADRKEYAKAKENFFKALFEKISNEFNDEVNAALKDFNAALPAEERERNKAAVAE